MPPEPSFLDGLRIASPCKASWDKMEGNHQVRFCGECKKNVYDLRFMTRAQSEALLLGQGEACVRMARRADGTVITSDCPVGASDQRKKAAAVAALGAGLIAATALLWKARSQPPPPDLAFLDVPRDVLVPQALYAGLGARLPPPPPELPHMGVVAMMPPPEKRIPHQRRHPPPLPPPTDTTTVDHEGQRLLSGNFKP